MPDEEGRWTEAELAAFKLFEPTEEERGAQRHHPPPIRVEGGIKARKRRGSIGSEWWSRRFVDLVESFGHQGRLQRGRAYARDGQVLELDIRPYEVAAKVQGSRKRPYKVTIGIAGIHDEIWTAVEAELGARAVFRARLLAGELPPELEEVFAGHGAALFPETPRELHLMCDCPDLGDPCKHAAAVLYLLAESFDTDPFLVLAWNGRTEEQLQAALRRAGPAAADPFDLDDEPLSPTDFWTPGAGLGALREPRHAPPAPPGLLLKLLDPPPVKVRRRTLGEVLAPAYAALALPEDPA